MTIKLSSLKANLDREEKGDWVEFPDWPGVEFNVSSLLIPQYTTARDLLIQRLLRQSKGKPIPRETYNVEIGKLFAKHILHGWRGLDAAYSPEKAEEILTDPEYRNVVAAIEYCAGRVSELDVEFVEDAGKNSGQPSGTGSGAKA